jgi:hypothetical protein
MVFKFSSYFFQSTRGVNSIISARSGVYRKPVPYDPDCSLKGLLREKADIEDKLRQLEMLPNLAGQMDRPHAERPFAMFLPYKDRRVQLRETGR